MNRNLVIGLSAFLAVCLSVSGCTTVSYYSQSVIGHSRIMLARKPINKVIPNAPQALRQNLELAIRLRQFAVQELSLPNSNSYSHYVALDRRYPVWNVVAAPEFSVVAKQWCYLVIGCAAYRGYFKEQAARDYAKKLNQQGFETMVGGVGAYSTLGWFADPILPSMFQHGDIDFAETLFHELAHQVLYVNGDSNFNEAFATVVGEYGVRQWLRRHDSAMLERYERRIKALQDFNRLIAQSKERLIAIYENGAADDVTRTLKLAEFSKLRENYENTKLTRWQGEAWFDGWFERPVNNARLAAFSTYRELVPQLEALLDRCGHDLRSFYKVLESAPKSDHGVDIPNRC